MTTYSTDRKIGLMLCAIVAAVAAALMSESLSDLSATDFSTVSEAGGGRHEGLTGETAPGFTLQDIEGNEVGLEDYGDQVLMINFWATWCGPCIDEMPTLVNLHSLYSERGFSVIGISVDDSADKVRAFAPVHELNYPLLIANAKVRADYGGVTAIPTTFMIDKKGVVRFVEVGKPADLLVFQQRIEELLQQ